MPLPSVISRRGPLLATAISLVLVSAWYFTYAPDTPLADLSGGHWTDHVSHLNATRLFPSVGWDMWSKPVAQQYSPLSDAQIEALPDGQKSLAKRWQERNQTYFFDVPGFDVEKPYLQGWNHIPRLYPPGDMVIVAPFSLLYHFTSVSFGTINRMLIFYFLCLAHIALYFFLRAAARADSFATPAPVLTLVLAYGGLVYWAMQGFYDAAALTPLLLCAAYLAERRSLAAVVAFCVAAFIHYRAYFYAPWVLFAAYDIVMSKQWRRWSKRDFAGAGVAVVLGILSLATFATVFGEITTNLKPNNAVFLRPEAQAVFLISFGIVAAVCAVNRAWNDAAVGLWMGLMLLTMSAVYQWYGLFLLPWLAAPVFGSAVRRVSRVAEARLLAFATAAALCCKIEFFPIWLLRIVQPLVND